MGGKELGDQGQGGGAGAAVRLDQRARGRAETRALDGIGQELDQDVFELDVRLHLDRIDVDRYLGPGEKSRRSKKATLEAAIDELGTFDVDAEVRVDEARVAGAKLKDAVVRIERNGGEP